MPDVILVGGGHNSLVCGCVLAAHGLEVHLIEAADELGGGTRTTDYFGEGTLHDRCSAVHPLGVLSPAFDALGLEAEGLEWAFPTISAAHPLDGRPAVMLVGSVADTASQLGCDAAGYHRLLEPLVPYTRSLISALLGRPGLGLVRPVMARFGLSALRSATGLLEGRFRGREARALFAGCAAHSILPLEFLGTAAVGLMFLLAGHARPWPVARGGSQSIARALERKFRHLGGRVTTGVAVRSLAELPVARAYGLGLSPKQVATIFPGWSLRYRNALDRYQYGPAVFKMDYVLSRQIPWRDERCASASTVHVGGDAAEIALSERQAWKGEYSARPFVMVCQQSHFDPTRSHSGYHTGYAYCHLPHGSTRSMVDEIEGQIERFAPGFRDTIVHRRSSTPADLQTYNAANEGGTITGGAAIISQLFFRPTIRWNPCTTPDPRIYLCSHATYPGGGVHGMCGFNAARSILSWLRIPERLDTMISNHRPPSMGSLYSRS